MRATVRLVRTATIIGAVGCPIAAQGAPVQDAESPRPLALADYYALKDVGSPVISPDGNWVAYVVAGIIEERNERVSRVWIVRSDGSAPARPLTPDSVPSRGPRWNSDGSTITYRTTSGETLFQDLGPDGTAMGAPYTVDGLGGTPVFSPEGSWIAFAADAEPPGASSPDGRTASVSEFGRKTADRFDGRIYDWMNYRFDRSGYLPDPRDPSETPPSAIFVLPAEGGEARQLTRLNVDASGLAWSPDGTRIAFVADLRQRDEWSYERADVWTVGLDGELHRLTDDGFNYSSPSWSPGGESLVVRGAEGLDVIIAEGRDRGAPTDIFRLDVAERLGGLPSARLSNLTEAWDLIPGAPTWGADDRIYFAAGMGGNTHLFSMPGGGGEVTQLTVGDRRARSFTFNGDYTRIAFVVTDPVTPGDVWSAPLPAPGGTGAASALERASEIRLSDVNGELLSGVELASPDRILFESADGTRIEGWILPARSYGDRVNGPDGSTSPAFPLVLQIHGGPHGSYGNSFSFDRQMLAARGYMVLFTNPRASTGYGEDFRWGTWGGWGFNDYDDVMAAVDHAVVEYSIDTTRMGVTGYSYGGFLTNWIITQTDRFRTAIAGASISNWVSDYGVADIPRTKESEFYGPPWTDRGLEHLMRSSPIVHAAGVTTPTLFLHGELDHRVPIEEAEQMYVALKKQGVPTRFVRYPESYHGGWSPWRTAHRSAIQLEWWDDWLSPGHFPPDWVMHDMIRDRVNSARATGIVLGVLDANGKKRVLAYGDAGSHASPLDSLSVFEIGSITKAFTGILLADMAGRGEVEFDTPVADYLPDRVSVPGRDGRDITLADLATHRSALPRSPANLQPADVLDPYSDYSVDQMYSFLNEHELRRDIGSEYEYSNLGMGLLGHALALHAGKSYGELVGERILRPLGMSMTSIQLTPPMEEHLATGHNARGFPTKNWRIPTLAGAGALRSNVMDMLAFAEANLAEGEGGLSVAMRESHRPRAEAVPGMSVGLGWHIRHVGESRIVWHNGGTGGYRTFLGFDPDQGVAVVVLTNSGQGADDIGFHLLNPELPLAPVGGD